LTVQSASWAWGILSRRKRRLRTARGRHAGSYVSTSGLAGNFEGDVTVSGTLSVSSKEFKIDDPLDPGNKYLVHASVESSEMMNIYNGNVTTDELGWPRSASPTGSRL